MPYHDSKVLPADPTVKIFLQGQLILEPQEDFTCDIGVNRCATNHQLSFEIRQRMADSKEPDVILMRVLEKIEPLGIDVDLEPASDEGVKKFVPTDAFARDDENADPKDFRWLVDLSGGEFHNAEVVINGNDTEPNIKIRDGIFYTAKRTDPDVVKVTRKGGATDNVFATDNFPLHRIAALIGVNIYLPDDTVKFRVKWTQNGEDKTLVLNKPSAGSGISHYEIRINNDPPFVDPDLDLPSHKELREYYKVVDTVFVNDVEKTFEPFELKFERLSTPDLGSPAVPCMPVGGGLGG